MKLLYDKRKKINMGTYKEYIEELKKKWIGKIVIYENKKYKVVDVDYNGMLLIDKKARFTDTTAVAIFNVNEVKEDNNGDR